MSKAIYRARVLFFLFFQNVVVSDPSRNERLFFFFAITKEKK